MRHASLHVLACVAIAVAGLTLALCSWLFADRIGGAATSGIGIGLLLGLVCLARALMELPALAGRIRLRAGRGILARWRLGPDEWNRFRAFDAARNQLGRDYRSDFKPGRETPADGVEVIFGADGVLMDGAFQLLRADGLPMLTGVALLPGAGAPDCLEFAVRWGGSRLGPPRTDRFRVPVAAGAGPAGRAAFDHFRAALRPPAREG